MSDIVAPKSYRQRDYMAGWRACEADAVSQGQQIADLEEAVERATSMAERYGEAIVAIGEALGSDLISDGARINRVRMIVAGLDSLALPRERRSDG